MKKIKNYLLFIIIAGSSFIWDSCTANGIVDNPPPFLQITEGPAEGEIVTLDRVTFVWKGSGSDFLFKYRLMYLDADNIPTTYTDWTQYSKESEISFANLDEGKYTFEVQATASGIESPAIKRIFTVNSIIGPTFSFYKVKTSIAVNQRDSISVWMEDVDSLAGFKIVLTFDRNIVNLVSVRTGQLPSVKGLSQIILPDFSDVRILGNANNTGRFELNSAFLMDFASFPANSLSGSGKVLSLVFEGKQAGTTNLDISNLELRNIKGQLISFSTPKSGKIVVN